MTNPSPPPSSLPVGRGIGFVLGFVVFLCMVMIGGAGYVKYQLDHAEAVMAAPGAAFVSDQEVFEKLRRAFGYSGFVGFAQNFATTHDPAILPDMRTQARQAELMIEHLPERTPGETRHDLQAILAVFQNALAKAEKDPANFTVADMAPLYAALPVLDSRVEGAVDANRLAAQDRLQFWSMLLTLVAWCSLIIASALAAGIYLVLRGRNSAPLRALSQSVRNMARGDMRTSIWGMERTDMLGELARTIDLARYHFSQLPDMSLLSEHGPVRLRFEGNTRSLFEAMMRVISNDSEQVRSQATGLAEAIHKQQEAIALISSRVDAVLHTVEKRAVDGDQHTRQALQNMLGSAQSLKNAQEHAADQLNRILPFLQERAQGMAEITQIAGKQVAQVLSSLTLSEHGLRASAEQSEEAIKKLSTFADNLGERMFGAVNLLQASGKVLAETTEKTQSRLNEAINLISTGQVPVSPPGSSPAMPDILPRLDAIAAAVDAAQKKIDERLQELVARPASGEGSVAVPVFTDSLMLEIRAGFDATARRIEQMHEQLASMTTGAPVMSGDAGGQMRDQWYQMAAQIEASRAALEQTITQQIEKVEKRLGVLNGNAPEIDPEAFNASQKQMEEQSQILSELVATLGVLDEHMQQIKSEIGHGKASGM